MKSLYIMIIVAAGLISIACTTKVSEWVLLNSKPNQYTLIYFHKNPIDEKIRIENIRIKQEIAHANIQFREIIKEDLIQPYYALYYQNRLFSKFAEPFKVNNLISSPLRNKIAPEIKAGKLCVMLFLKTGIKEKDEDRLQILKKTMEISPFGKIITVVELNRNDRTEDYFVDNLLNVESDLKSINEPMLFGIFGRFKALEPLIAKGITEENINLMINFLTSDCSCIIKDDLPGTDILYINDWEKPATALVNKILDENPSLLHK